MADLWAAHRGIVAMAGECKAPTQEQMPEVLKTLMAAAKACGDLAERGSDWEMHAKAIKGGAPGLGWVRSLSLSPTPAAHRTLTPPPPPPRSLCPSGAGCSRPT